MSAGYSQNNPDLARDGSDCNQHEFELKKNYLLVNFPQKAM